MSNACPKCGNQDENLDRGRVPRNRDVPARLIHQCNVCNVIWYTRDPSDQKEPRADKT
jgi:hypothetical protein